MHFSQIEAFAAVAELRSFSKAAQALFLSQPTVSAHIRALEDELNVKLLLRSTKEVVLTDEGRLFLDYAGEILRLRNRAVTELNNTSGEIRGTISIAASTVPSLYILPPVLTALYKKHPGLYFLVRQFDSNEVVRKVIRMECELGITGTTFSKGNCEYVPFLEDRLVIITPNTPEYRRLNGVMPCELLKNLPFVSREPGSGTKKEYEQFLASIGVENKDMNFAAQMFSTESVIRSVRHGLGISIVSKAAVSESVRSGLVLSFDFDTPLLTRKLYFVYRKKHSLSNAVRVFMDAVLDYTSDSGENEQ